MVIISTQECNFREVLLGWIPLRIGSAGEKYSHLCTSTVLPSDSEPEVERNLSLLRAFPGVSQSLAVEWVLDFLPRIEDEPGLERMLPDRKPSDRLIGIHPGTKRPSRQWPADRFSRLIEFLLQKESRFVVLTGVSSEDFLIRQIIQDVTMPSQRKRIINLCGETSIRQMAALLRELDLFICCDTGVMQLANALETNMVVLFGPGDVVKWGPTRNRKGTAVICHQVECSPCYKFSCEDQKCMKSITVEEVTAAAEEILS